MLSAPSKIHAYCIQVTWEAGWVVVAHRTQQTQHHVAGAALSWAHRWTLLTFLIVKMGLILTGVFRASEDYGKF